MDAIRPNQALRATTGAVVLLCALSVAAQARPVAAPAPTTNPWGHTANGQAVQCVELVNRLGMRVRFIDYGATLTAIELPDRAGRRANIVLGLPDLAAYEHSTRRYGAVMGRYAGRIAGARFVLDGREVKLPPNARGMHLHGDPDGFDKRVWLRRDFSEADSLGSVFEMDSPAGDQGFPGRLRLSVLYRLMRNSNEFRIEYQATTDAPTVLNPTNHAYFNLAGAGSAGLGSHRFTIAADRYAVADERRLPTGELAPVAGTPLDFRAPASIAKRIAEVDLDHSLVLTGWTGTLRYVLRVDDLASGRRMDMATTEPSVQLNSGNGFDGSEVGAEGRAYARHDGFALETQHLPDSPNQAQFPSTRLLPGQSFHSETRYRFSTF
jgi:aldose 1-epimerase